MSRLTEGAVRRSEAVQRAAERAVVQGSPAVMMASVTGTHADGTVDITTALGPIASVRRLKHYTSPAINDVVLVIHDPSGNWFVVDALATS